MVADEQLQLASGRFPEWGAGGARRRPAHTRKLSDTASLRTGFAEPVAQTQRGSRRIGVSRIVHGTQDARRRQRCPAGARRDAFVMTRVPEVEVMPEQYAVDNRAHSRYIHGRGNLQEQHLLRQRVVHRAGVNGSNSPVAGGSLEASRAFHNRAAAEVLRVLAAKTAQFCFGRLCVTAHARRRPAAKVSWGAVRRAGR